MRSELGSASICGFTEDAWTTRVQHRLAEILVLIEELRPEFRDEAAGRPRWADVAVKGSGEHVGSLLGLTAARADYLWCVRARLMERSDNAHREFFAGFLSMEEFYEHREIPQTVSAVACDSIHEPAPRLIRRTHDLRNSVATPFLEKEGKDLGLSVTPPL